MNVGPGFNSYNMIKFGNSLDVQEGDTIRVTTSSIPGNPPIVNEYQVIGSPANYGGFSSIQTDDGIKFVAPDGGPLVPGGPVTTKV